MNRRPWDTILYYAPVYTRTGYGTISRAYIRALHEAGLPVVVRSIGWTDPGIPPEDAALLKKLESAPVAGNVAAIFHATPSEWAAFTPIPDLVQRINVSLFETDRAPAEWVLFLNQFDQIWTPTEFHREAYVRSGARPELFRLIPFTHPWIDAPHFTPVERRDGAFRFLNISEFTPRKRLDVLLSAYFEEFTPADAAQFYLKIGYPKWKDAELTARTRREFFNLLLEIEQRYPQRAPLIVDETLGTPEELRALTASADTYVSADCAGYTLPVIETMACGRVAVTVDWCGGADLVSSDFGYRIPVSAQTVPIPESVWSVQPLYRDHQWTDIRVEDVRRILRDAYERAPEERRRMGEAAREFCRQRMSGPAVAAQMVEALSFQAAAHLPQAEAARGRGAPLPAAKPETPKAQAGAGPGTPDGWPDEVIEHLQQADAHFAAGDLEAAREALSHALDLAPDDPQLIVAYGNVLLKTGDVESARREFLKAAALHPGYAPAHVNLAAVLWHLGQSAEAEASLRRALALNPEDAESLKLLDHLRLNAERFEEAVKLPPGNGRGGAAEVPAASKAIERREAAPDGAAQHSASPAPRVQIRWGATIFDFSGYSQLSRLALPRLAAKGAQVQIQPLGADEKLLAQLHRRPAEAAFWKTLLERRVDDGVYVIFHPPLSWQGGDFFAHFRRQNPGFRAYVGLTMFETDRLPPGWAAACNGMDEIWVPSTFNLETFARAGVDPARLQAIPFGLDAEKYDRARVTPLKIPGRRGFTFLSVFQWNKRKGWDVLLRAYLSAFTAEDDVCLVLRAYPDRIKTPPIRERIDSYARALGHDPARIPPIILLEDFIPEDQMPALYAAADAFVLPTRGEGWGIPFMEAMAAGLPAIATRWSAHLDFMNGDNSYLIDVEGLAPVDADQTAENPYYTPDQQWAEPSVDHTAALMRRVFEDRETARAVGLRAQQDIRQHWTLDRTADTLLQRASRLANGSPASYAQSRSIPQSVLWSAPIYDPSGYADEARHFLLNLSAQGIEVAARPVGRNSDNFRSQLDRRTRKHLDAMLAKPAPPIRINVLHFPAYAFERDPQAAYNIGRVMFETDGLPADWVAKCNQMDEIWAPTDFNLETFRRAGVTAKLIKVPGGIDAKRFRPGLKPLRIPGARGTVFLSIFEWIYRKGWDVLLRAWAEAFAPDDDVSLVLRTYPVNAQDSPDATAEIENRINRFLQEALGKSREQVAPIVVLGAQIPEPRLPRLFAAADVYVAPSRGEGWGRPHMQAMACGLPVIATRWSGNLEFMNDDNSFLIDVEELATIDERAEIPFYRGQHWAEPSAAHLAALMRRAHENPKEAAAVGKRARQDMAEHWTWDRAARVIVERLAVISKQLSVISNQSAVHSPQSAIGNPQSAIRWEGSQFVHHSLALINRELCIRLAQDSNVVLSIIPYEPHQFDATSDPRFAHIARHLNKPLSKPADVHIRHQWPPNFTPPPEGKWVIIQPWEFGSMPKKWIEVMCDGVDEVWAYTNFVRDCYIQSGLPAERVHVVPPGVDADSFRPDAPPVKLKTGKRFKFLFVGGTIWRKGPDVLLDAYLKSFTAADDVTLVVKDMGGDSFYKGMTFADQIRQAQSDPRAPEILYLTENMPPGDLPGLYTACDCLVHPYRGEGFGLPIAEAMACGLPAIVTGAGACLDFCDETTAYFIPAEKQYLPEKRIGQWETVDLPFIYEPDRAATAGLMRRVFENRDEGRAMGARASEHILENFTWERSAAQVMERIRALRQQPIKRFDMTADTAAHEMLAKGEAAISVGKWDEAEAVFEAMVGEFPGRADAHAGLGSALLVRGQAARAADVLARAVELAPRDADLGNRLGVALFQNGDLKSAESMFQKALSLAPDNVDSILNLVEVYRAQSYYPEAADTIKRAVRVAPQDPNVLTAFGTLGLELGDAEAVRIALDNLRQVAPDHPSVRILEETLVTV